MDLLVKLKLLNEKHSLIANFLILLFSIILVLEKPVLNALIAARRLSNIYYTNMNQDIELFINQSLELQCFADGIEAPNITWYKVSVRRILP